MKEERTGQSNGVREGESRVYVRDIYFGEIVILKIVSIYTSEHAKGSPLRVNVYMEKGVDTHTN